MLGCMPPDISKMSEYEDDNPRRTASAVVKPIETFCSPRGLLDEGLFKSLLLKVRVVCVDGALLKTANFLRTTSMPNIVLIVRDPAHVIRSSTATLLQNALLFDEQYSRLFSGRHAVLKNLMNSNVW